MNDQEPADRIVVDDAFHFLAQLEPQSVDLLVSSPPYCMGKEYDTSADVKDWTSQPILLSRPSRIFS